MNRPSHGRLIKLEIPVYTVPRLGEKASVTIPRIVLEAATSAAERLTDGERGRS